jgi:hypothetical protein
MLPTKGSNTYAKDTHVHEKEDSFVNEYSALFLQLIKEERHVTELEC